MSEVIERFDKEHNAYHDITPGRRRDSNRVLRELEMHAGVGLLDVGPSEFKTYLASMVEQGKAIGTVRKHANLIRPFFTWAWTIGLVDAERLMGIKAIRPPRGSSAAANGKPRPYSRDEVKKFWAQTAVKYPFLPPESNYLDRFSRGTSRFPRIQKHAWRLQFTAIAALAMHGGLRREEIFTITETEAHPENAYIVVRGAAKNPEAEVRERVVPWTTPELRTAMEEWIAFRTWLNPPHDSLWMCLYRHDHYIKPLRFRKFEMLMHDLGTGWEFHRLRHTALTEMLRAGYPIQEVQRIAGHARIQQTLAYAELLPDDLIKTAARQSDKLSTALSPEVQAA